MSAVRSSKPAPKTQVNPVTKPSSVIQIQAHCAWIFCDSSRPSEIFSYQPATRLEGKRPRNTVFPGLI
jgi:hypothetical protein